MREGCTRFHRIAAVVRNVQRFVIHHNRGDCVFREMPRVRDYDGNRFTDIADFLLR